MNEPGDTLVEREFDPLIMGWLQQKYLRNKSKRTVTAYQETMARYLLLLDRSGLSLLSPPEDLVDIVTRWLDTPQREGKLELAPATFNQRRAILASFYHYAIISGAYPYGNPIHRIARRHTQTQPEAHPLDIPTMRYRLFAIDRTTEIGMRDYALIELAVMTGKRDSELRGLNLGDLTPQKDGILIAWRHLKGGKTEERLYEHPHASSLMQFTLHHYGGGWQTFAQLPVFPSLSYNGSERLTRSGITHIFGKRLGMRRIHATRKLFAELLIEAGASAPEVQALMNHASLATTQRYFERRDSQRNKFAGQMRRILLEAGDEETK